MKKITTLIILCTVVLAPSILSAQERIMTSTSSTLKATSLTIGASGSEVSNYQQFLKSLGYYQGLVDGKFGPAMAKSVSTFQLVNKMSADGILGAGTKIKINEAAASIANSQNVPSITIPSHTQIMSTPFPGTVCKSTTPPWIKVLTPNGGEIYNPTSGIPGSNQIPVTWSSCNLSSPTVGLTLAFYAAGATSPTTTLNLMANNPQGIATTTPNDGTELVTIPSGIFMNYGMQPGTFYRVYVTNNLNLVGSTVVDVSDNLFTINDHLFTNQVSLIDSDIKMVSLSGNNPGVAGGAVRYRITASLGNSLYIQPGCGYYGGSNNPANTSAYYRIDQGTTAQLQSTMQYTHCFLNTIGTPTVTPNGNWLIPQGTSQDFEMVVLFRPNTSGSYRIKLPAVGFVEADVPPFGFAQPIGSNSLVTQNIAL